MRIFALADLHLSFSKSKPMDIFGPAWENHHVKIERSWRALVSEEDWVLVCGDISWAMQVEEAREDLDFISRLPGKKILIRGNHDYWWKSISKVREKLPAGMVALQNDYFVLENMAVCGTRGWTLPNGNFTEEDLKIYSREIIRAGLSLQKAEAGGHREKIFMLHYPPFVNGRLDPEFGRLFSQYGVFLCVYGHMHGSDHRFAVEGEIDGVKFVFAAADYTGFSPVEIWPGE